MTSEKIIVFLILTALLLTGCAGQTEPPDTTIFSSAALETKPESIEPEPTWNRVSDDREMLDKISYFADYEGRSVSSHILVLIRENIKAHKQMHGTIEGRIRPDINVKPARKH